MVLEWGDGMGVNPYDSSGAGGCRGEGGARGRECCSNILFTGVCSYHTFRARNPLQTKCLSAASISYTPDALMGGEETFSVSAA